MRGGPPLGGSVDADFEDDDGDYRDGDDLEEFKANIMVIAKSRCLTTR